MLRHSVASSGPLYATRLAAGPASISGQAVAMTPSRAKSTHVNACCPILRRALVMCNSVSPGGPRNPKSQKSKEKESMLSEWVRRTPVLNRLYDGTLLLGDLVMLTATEVSSERITWEVLPQLLAVMLGSWVAAATCLNDYNGRPPMSNNWYLGLMGTPVQSIVNATQTWAFSVFLQLVVYSVMVANHSLDAGPIVEGLATEDLSPQVEVMVASMVTMSCWRGIAAKLRWMS